MFYGASSSRKQNYYRGKKYRGGSYRGGRGRGQYNKHPNDNDHDLPRKNVDDEDGDPTTCGYIVVLSFIMKASVQIKPKSSDMQL